MLRFIERFEGVEKTTASIGAKNGPAKTLYLSHRFIEAVEVVPGLFVVRFEKAAAEARPDFQHELLAADKLSGRFETIRR